MIDLDWGDGRHKFALPIGQLRELQTKCDAGPGKILRGFFEHSDEGKMPKRENYQLGLADPQYRSDISRYQLLKVLGGDWRIDQIRETIRLGLIGGGMAPTAAHLLVSTYIDATSRDLLHSKEVATEILMKALVGDPDDPVGKKPADQTTPETAGSPGPLSSDGAPSSE